MTLRACRAMIATFAAAITGCALPAATLQEDRLRYNVAIKAAAEEQLLLNIVRLRYSDTPTSLAVTSVAMQSETVRTLGLMPFFGTAANEANGLRSFAGLLPQAQLQQADRPTVTLAPVDDQEFTRRLFTPLTTEAVVYLARTTWPVSTVFRLALENLNWVPNAENASGPVPAVPPQDAAFRLGIAALQALQDRGQVVFSGDDREEPVGGPVRSAALTAADLVAAAREGLEFRTDPDAGTATLVRRRRAPVMRVHPDAVQSAAFGTFAEVFRLRRGVDSYDIASDRLDPFNVPPRGVAVLDLETRSLLQILFFVAKGVQVPEAHVRDRTAPGTPLASGNGYDWTAATSDLIRIRATDNRAPPPAAHVAVRHLDHWYYIERHDARSMATFSLLMHLARMEVATRTTQPTLTLPIGSR